MLPNIAFQQLAGASALLVGIVLLTAGVPKARAPAKFAGQITAYGIAPAALSPALARIVSSAELLAGAMLIAGLAAPPPLREIGAGLAILLFAAFLTALVSAQARGRHIACACFGGDSELETVDSHSIVRTGLLLALALAAMSPIHSERPVELAGFAAVLGALVAVASELARLLGPSRRATSSILDQLTAAATVADEAKVTQ